MKNKVNTIENKNDILFNLAKKSFEEAMVVTTEEDLHIDSEFIIEDILSLAIIIGFSGEINGRILLSTSVEYGKNIAVAIKSGNLDKKEDLYIYLTEFANMLCEKFEESINDAFGKRKIWISPPAIFSAKDLDVITPNVASMKVFYECSLGKFIVDIGFSENIYEEF